MSQIQGLFFKSNRTLEYREALAEVQTFLAKEHSNLLSQKTEESKIAILRYIRQYITEQGITINGIAHDHAVEMMYTEMAEYSFLTSYLERTDIEEININAWDDIEVQYSNGQYVKLDETFRSPEHALNVVRRMLHASGMVLDHTSPAVLGHLQKNVRITALKSPVIDEDVGISASIRFINPRQMQTSDFLDNGTATKEELDLMLTFLSYGISICVAGSTSSGKTTLMDWMLHEISQTKRIFSIEDGSRELSLVDRENGRITNSVVSTLTRKSENEKLEIDQEALLDIALRYHPEIICVGEMRSSEAYTAQESARTGHTVLTSVHSNSCEATYRRMVTLCKRKYDMGVDTLMELVTEAFPIIVYMKQLNRSKRRIMEIAECILHDDGSRENRTLYRYVITKNEIKDQEHVIEGKHVMVNPISDSLAKRLSENGMPEDLLQTLKRGGKK